MTCIYLIKRRASLTALYLYCKKSINLSICYIEFFEIKTLNRIYKTSQVAFFCSIYDYATDYVKSELEFREVMKIINNACATEVASVVRELYNKEINDSLNSSGLERGWISLFFIIKHIGIEKDWYSHYTDIQLVDIGESLQLVDDVLDYEHDKENGDLNCLIEDYAKYRPEIRSRVELLKSNPLFASHENSPVMNKMFSVTLNKRITLN